MKKNHIIKDVVYELHASLNRVTGLEVIPFIFLVCFSMAATQEAQVMPVMRRKHFSRSLSSPSKAAFSCHELVVLALWGVFSFSGGKEKMVRKEKCRNILSSQ